MRGKNKDECRWRIEIWDTEDVENLGSANLVSACHSLIEDIKVGSYDGFIVGEFRVGVGEDNLNEAGFRKYVIDDERNWAMFLTLVEGGPHAWTQITRRF